MYRKLQCQASNSIFADEAHFMHCAGCDFFPTAPQERKGTQLTSTPSQNYFPAYLEEKSWLFVLFPFALYFGKCLCEGESGTLKRMVNSGPHTMRRPKNPECTSSYHFWSCASVHATITSFPNRRHFPYRVLHSFRTNSN